MPTRTSTLKLFDDGNDVLRIVRVDADDVVIAEARGWVSAIKQHVVDVNGVRTRRQMTTPERRAYALSLLPVQPNVVEPILLDEFSNA